MTFSRDVLPEVACAGGVGAAACVAAGVSMRILCSCCSAAIVDDAAEECGDSSSPSIDSGLCLPSGLVIDVQASTRASDPASPAAGEADASDEAATVCAFVGGTAESAGTSVLPWNTGRTRWPPEAKSKSHQHDTPSLFNAH